MAAALRSGAPQLAVVAAGKPASGRVMPVQARRPAFAARFGRGEWPAAALLAASLVLGVMLGSAGTFDATMQEVARGRPASSSSRDPTARSLRWARRLNGQPDEDLL